MIVFTIIAIKSKDKKIKSGQLSMNKEMRTEVLIGCDPGLKRKSSFKEGLYI